MNRAEYKERLSEIATCIENGQDADALDYLDSINWSKLHNVNILLDGAELYERLGKLEDSKELLEIAHDRSPAGRMIIYRLAIACAQVGDIEQARFYYQRFIELAPNDNLRFIIKYHITKAQGADDLDLIPILEELKTNELLENWAFELACLYRKTGQVDKCISVLDEIILWFGEGPYVEKSLEMKMLYLPLSEEQADKYHSLTSGDSTVEIRPGDKVAANEYLGHTIRIPEIEVSSEKFNTVNLQAEIRKNIEEIMMASEMGEVSENMEAIKGLVEDIPYLRVKEEEETPEKKKFDTSRFDETLKNKFKEFLSEEFDGQISLNVPEQGEIETQIDGQLSIGDIMEKWEKTKRAAEAALIDAKERELLEYKQKAIKRASDVLERLLENDYSGDALSKYRSEMSKDRSSEEEETEEETEPEVSEELEPSESELSESEEYESETSESVENDTPESEPEHKTFVIPIISGPGESSGAGFEIPVISAPKAEITTENIEESEETSSPEESVETEPVVEKIDEIEAGELTGETGKSEPEDTETIAPEDEEAEEKDTEEKLIDAKDWTPPELDKEASSIIDADRELKAINEMLQTEIDKLMDSEDVNPGEKENTGETENPEPKEEEDSFQTYSEIKPEHKEVLSYFASVQGMEENLIGLISKTVDVMRTPGSHLAGNIIIQGRSGSGKTKLAADIIKIVQMETGRPSGNVGRISGEKLNEKDIRVLFEKVKDGALIVENAGKLNRETLISLNLMMENDKSGILVIIEDTRPNIEKIFKIEPRFSKKFTERISIPLMTIDELVNFGKIYAAENGYLIDEMGVLAMYDRINLVGRPEKPACIASVKNIVDEAIASQLRQKKGLRGLFSGRGQDEDGAVLLQEKDFLEG